MSAWNDFRFCKLQHRHCGGQVKPHTREAWRCSDCGNAYLVSALERMDHAKLGDRFLRTTFPTTGTVVLEEHEEDRKRFMRTRYL